MRVAALAQSTVFSTLTLSMRWYCRPHHVMNNDNTRGVQRVSRLIQMDIINFIECHWLAPSIATILQKLLLARISLCTVDAAYCYRRSSVVCLSVCLSVGRSVIILSPAETAEPIEMPFETISVKFEGQGDTKAHGYRKK